MTEHEVLSSERRKNTVTFYFANGIGCPQPAYVKITYATIEEAKQAKKETKVITQ